MILVIGHSSDGTLTAKAAVGITWSADFWLDPERTPGHDWGEFDLGHHATWRGKVGTVTQQTAKTIALVDLTCGVLKWTAT